MLNLPGFSDPLVQNSRYKNGTTKTCSIALSVVPYRALQCDGCLVITTRSIRSAPVHGANAGSNPAGEANSISYGRIVYSLFNYCTRSRQFRNLNELRKPATVLFCRVCQTAVGQRWAAFSEDRGRRSARKPPNREEASALS